MRDVVPEPRVLLLGQVGGVEPRPEVHQPPLCRVGRDLEGRVTHPRLRMRHAPFEVTPTAAQHWLVHFRAGLDAAGLTPEQDARFWDYVTHAAQFMVNTME